MNKRFGVYRISTPLLAVLLIGVMIFVGGIGFYHRQSVAADTKPTAQRTLPVLMYHHLTEDKSKCNDYTITPQQFESDLQKIRQLGYTAVSMQQLADYYDGKADLPEKSILITFDDGYYSVYLYAYPLLKQYQMPAVCFILGAYTQLYSDGEKQNPAYAHMTWEQLSEMQASGLITMGSHSYDLHHPKGKGERYGISINAGENCEVYMKAIKADLSKLSDVMERELHTVPDCFAYPFGAICKESYPLMEQMGFRFIFTCEEKVNCLSQGTKMPIKLGRYNRASRYTTESFFDKINGT